MKKAFLLFAICFLAVNISASEILTLDFGWVKIKAPFVETDVTYLYDFPQKESLVGFESPIFKFPRPGIDIIGGGIKSLDNSNGIPFIGINKRISAEYFRGGVTVGLWFGYDFKSNIQKDGNRNKARRGGIKASIPLW